MLFHDGEFRLYPPRFSYIWVFGQPVFGSDDVRSQSQSRPAMTAARPRGFGLQPVEKRQAELAGSFQMPRGILLAHFLQVSQPVVILTPVDQAEIARIRPTSTVPHVRDPAVNTKTPLG